MIKVDYQCNFNLGDCIKTLGLEEKGRVQKVVSESILMLSEQYVPFENGDLMDSGEVVDNTMVVWGGKKAPYARYMWNGIVYEDPDLHCAGFLTDNGWRSRKDVQKVPTDRKLEYHNGGLRGPRWVERMLQDGGLKEIERRAREEVKK